MIPVQPLVENRLRRHLGEEYVLVFEVVAQNVVVDDITGGKFGFSEGEVDGVNFGYDEVPNGVVVSVPIEATTFPKIGTYPFDLFLQVKTEKLVVARGTIKIDEAFSLSSE